MNAIREQSFDFAVKIYHCCKKLQKENKEFIISNQLLRSGTAVAALYAEATYAQSTKDFIHKLSIALKECNESIYWLKLLKTTGELTPSHLTPLEKQSKRLKKILISIILTTKNNNRDIHNP
ncbi:four helix bundle protein [Robertkochia solimangrovi]|uniref:four helix bundle protein n=1 Tax=Robertkochia solimangrovi TaxID=2213046 RepID=UPI00117D979D|nr:four helix bundle protein [Robertkochia solimangrovi]TRZ44966.1 four helix bundle protein [Robertkochia solimangrovi]